jgi:hypothetical protein
MWKRAYKRARGGSVLIQKLHFIRDKNRLYGMSPQKEEQNSDDDDMLLNAKKNARCVIFPDNTFI